MARRKWLFALALVLAGIAVLALVLWSVYRRSDADARAHFEREVRLAKEEGLPTTPEDLARLTHVPDGENAAPLYKRAVQEFLKVNPKIPGFSLDVIDPDRPATLEAARLEVAPYRRAIDQFRAASKRPGYDFPHDWNRDRFQFEEFHQLDAPCLALAKAALIEALDGNFGSAHEDFAAIARVSRQVARQPFGFAGLEAALLRVILCDAAWRIIRIRPEEPALAMVERVLGELGPPPSLRNEIGAEVVVLLVSVRTNEAIGRLEGTPTPIVDLPVFRFEAYAMSVKALRDEFKAAMQDPEYGPRARQRFLDVEKGVDRSLDPRSKLATLMVFGFSKTIMSYTRSLAMARAVTVGVSLMRSRARAGRFPEALPKLGENGIDPLTEKPWVYRREGDGFRLASAATFPAVENQKERPQVEIVFTRPVPSERTSAHQLGF
ncbi:MAG: hypothetical protein HYR64_00300 [Fimbriimonas ginsengisoli]|uniref:Uncharacterized protein n=1 Tax=Fimbriimonas ginsengisoli TaxID=1005039 RepID=A0A931LYK8_FIMGI|nr:hypothetical protein [Fimbriimonas ginsengisoli]